MSAEVANFYSLYTEVVVGWVFIYLICSNFIWKMQQQKVNFCWTPCSTSTHSTSYTVVVLSFVLTQHEFKVLFQPRPLATDSWLGTSGTKIVGEEREAERGEETSSFFSVINQAAARRSNRMRKGGGWWRKTRGHFPKFFFFLSI